MAQKHELGYKSGAAPVISVLNVMLALNLVERYSRFFNVFAGLNEEPEYDAKVKQMGVELTGKNLTGEYSHFTLKNGLDVILHVHDDQSLPLNV